ncbi:MAG: DUF305 domain-containing protein, partial [Gammaproteobacteria bacterium]|nr:DUF305 domain-containing protein [Gammaproteobacteria bacterium]
MNPERNRHHLAHLAAVFALCWFVVTTSSATGGVPIVQPGAPGEANRQLSAEEAVDIAKTSHSPDDTKFMQDMIPHHNQAVQMSALVADRTNRPAILDLAGRIDASQQDEIDFMQRWLRERGEEVPDPTAHHAMHTNHTMAGMASSEQMAELATLQGTDFDRLFLQLMIPHHEGAITMVEELLEQPGAAYDPILYEFTSDIVNDQAAEIERMNALLGSLSTDPRASLSPGFENAGEAILNMKLVASMRKPAGFFDPANPLEAPAVPVSDDEEDEKDEEDNAPIVPPDRETRSPMLSFANTDMAFAGDVLVAGNYHGFNVYQLNDNGVPVLMASIVCPGGQGDVSIVGNLLIMSVQETRSRLDCGLEGVSEDVSPDRFRGIRIFDISDLARPVQVGAV